MFHPSPSLELPGKTEDFGLPKSPKSPPVLSANECPVRQCGNISRVFLERCRGNAWDWCHSTLMSLLVLSQRAVAITASPAWPGGSQPPSSCRGHTLRVWWPLPGHCQPHLRVQTSLCGRKPILDVLKTAGRNSLKAEPETKSCQTWGKLDLSRASLLSPFSSKVPKKSQPCLCHSHSLWSKKCSFRWSP